MDDDFWKKAGEAIDAQIKELAERQAINTAKYLNESHAAASKEMNNEKLIEQLKTAAGCYFGEISPLFREAAAEIERLEELMKQNNNKHMELMLLAAQNDLEERDKEIERLGDKIWRSDSKFVEMAGKLKATNDNYNVVAKNNDELLKMYAPTVRERDKLIEENIRLNKEVAEYKGEVEECNEEIKDLKDILVDRNDAVDIVVKLNDEHIREKIRLQEQVEALEKSFPGYETVHIKPEEINWNNDLRDQFACAAVEGLVSNGIYNPESNARWAYQQADAMLKAREK